MSQTTKRALAASLKKLLIHKPLSKITITDITEDCEVNRHTFYYHFQDIYDLIDWIYETEMEKVIADNKTYETWADGVQALFEYALNNKTFTINYICLFDYLFISSQMSAKPYFMGSTGILHLR